MPVNDPVIVIKKDDLLLQEKFHDFIDVIFPGLSFRQWADHGFWTVNYTPFCLMRDERIIANVSASLMTVFINDKAYRTVQFGAVGTRPEYRGQGHAARLMNHVLDHFRNAVYLFFLYANETVLDFYPKFGFQPRQEHLFIADGHLPAAESGVRKLDVKQAADYALLQNLIEQRLPLSRRFGADQYGFITSWYLFNIHHDHIYYLQDENIVFIMEQKDHIQHIYDIIFCKPFDFTIVLPKLILSPDIRSFHYYFAPDQIDFPCNRVLADNSGLFILGDIDLGSRPFRFPPTAIT